MNENLDLTKILKYFPKGTKFYSMVDGEVEFDNIDGDYCHFKDNNGKFASFYKDGRAYKDKGECVLFPSKEKHDWSRFEVPNKKVKVTLHPFDKVLGMNEDISDYWEADLLSEYVDEEGDSRYICIGGGYPTVIPYNKDTAHLLGTSNEPEVEYEIEFSKEFKE